MYDVIVVGAGPSGGMASYTIALHGFSVAIIERKKEIGKPLQCGEGINKFCLEDAGLPKGEWIKWKVKGVKSILPGGYYFYTKQEGYSIDRVAFDKWIVEKGVENGAKLLNERFKTIIKVADGWKIITNKNEYYAKIVIGADGPSSSVSYQLGLLKNREYLRAYQYKFKGNIINDNWFHIYWGEEFRGGYGWVFPRGDEYNVGIGGVSASIEKLNLFCKKLGLDVSKKFSIVKGAIPFNFEFKSRAENGIMIVGDAAGLTNPATGGGIHAALVSGKMAGEIAIESLEKEKIEITLRYDKMIKRTPFLDPVHIKAAKYLQKWKDDDWKFLGKILNGKYFHELSLFKSFLAGIKNPKYMLRGREMLTIRKSMKINQKYGW